MAERRLPTPLTVAFQERATAELCTLKRSLHDKLKKDITREVYNQNVLKHKEDAVVAHIRYLRGEKEGEVGSPESDVFVTPKASPSDPHFGGSFEAATHRAYYSLVHLEDHNSQSLERELAEQDELSKSFRSILIKENQPTPVKQRSVKSSKSYEQVRIEPPLKPSQPRQTYQKSKLVLKLTDEMSLKREEEIMSNPDSCLEPMSSGYATGYSPKDTNNSEALGADTTEIVTSEDIPHDDKSRGSSSVSSDPGTWDSTFPTNDENTCIEKEHTEVAQSESAEKETLSPCKNPSDETVSQHHSEEKHEYMCRITEKKDSYLSIMTENKLKPPSHEYSSCSSPNNFFIDASSLRDENEMYLPSIQNPVFPSTYSEPKTINCDDLSLKNETEKSDLEISKFNCFYAKEDRSLNNLESKEVKDEFLENHKLIRRNTFDLDPEDTMLSRLKDDYGNSLPPSETSTTVDDLNKINKEGKPKGAYSECSKYITGKEDDVHSPDSLNNDFHSESFTSQNTHKVHYASTHMLNGETFTYAEVHSEPVSSTAEVEHTITSTNDEANKDSLSYNKLPSDLGTGFDLNNSYESESPRRSGNSTSSPKSNASYTKESYYDKLEGTPIVSGGTQISDVSSSEYSVTASPVTRRKTEHAPILSGGFDDIPMPEEKKPKPKSVSSLSTSWVVDMSDVGKSPPESLNENKPERQRSSNSGTGFFIPLDDPFPSFDSYTSTSSAERSDSGHNRRNSSFHERNSSCGFFIDLNENAHEKRTPLKTEVPSQEKKLFSMFIDIGNSKSSDSTSPKSKPGSPFFPTKRKGPSIAERLSAKHLDKKSNSTSSDSGLDLVEHPEIAKGRMLFNENLENSQNLSDSSNYDSGIATKRQSFYMFIGNEESPVTRRRTLPPNIRQNPNRHSWNNELKQAYKSESLIQRKEHKRSSSVSYDQSFPEDRLTSGPTSIEESCLKLKEKKNKSMLSSWHGPIKPSSELTRIIANGAKQEFKEKARESNKSLENSEAEKAEDMSCSIKSDEVFDVSNATVSSKDDTNRTFIVDDVSKAVNVNTNDLELSTPSQDIVSDFSKDDSATDPIQEPKSTCSDKTNKSSVCEGDIKTPKQPDPVEPPDPVQEASSGFLKLSDMDKAPVVQTWKSVSRSQSEKNSRMTRSIPEASFLEQRVLTNSASSRSLSRLFPHLYPKTDSREGSQQSSMQSSIIEPSPLEVSTEEEGSCGSGGGGSCSRLGEDLLRMFLDEISPDVTVEVGGRRIKAHKCILSSRCQYFAGMLSGGWVESAGNVISLQGFNYNTVHFALCHIYSGASQIPETINIVELATLADMLCLEGLKEVIMYTLKVKYCHFFHKPCSGCLVGVIECLPLAAAYSLDEIYRKSLRWITKHFVKVWPTKGFASLPKELLDKCLKQQIVHLCCDNILETVMGCDKLEATIPNVRWANPVFSLNSKLHEATVKYLTQHFSSVLASQTFMHLGQEDSWTVTRLEETLLNVSKSLSPDQSCQSYKRIKAILGDINRTDLEEIDLKLEFLELLTKLETTIEDCLIRQAGRAARTTSWAKMDLSLRRKIQEAACLVFTPGPRPSSSSRDVSRTSKHGEMKPKSPAPSQASSRRSVAPSPAAPKTTQSPLPKPRTPKNFSQVKSRYLEPKPARREGEPGQNGQQGPTQRRLSGGSGGGKAISSSDSSRNSSPAATRVSRPGTAERRTPVAGRRLQGPGSQPSPPPPRATFSTNPKDSQKPTTSKAQPEVKDQLLKRQSTFRVATKSSVAKQVAPGSRQPSKTRPQSSNIPTKAGVTVGTGRAKTASAVRSGTFLREDSAHGQRRPH